MCSKNVLACYNTNIRRNVNYKKIYSDTYFNGENSFFYSLGYGNIFQIPYFNNLFTQIKPHVKRNKKVKVLDVGCAFGYMLKKFPDNCELNGIDISDFAITQAKKLLPNATLKVGGAETTFPFKDNYFDVVICNDVIEHLEHPKKALENMHRVLKKGGVLYINTPNLNSLRKIVFAKPDKMEHHISLFSHADLASTLRGSGFKIIDRWTYTTLPVFFFWKFRSNVGHEQAFICKK